MSHKDWIIISKSALECTLRNDCTKNTFQMVVQELLAHFWSQETHYYLMLGQQW